MLDAIIAHHVTDHDLNSYAPVGYSAVESGDGSQAAKQAQASRNEEGQ